MIRNIIVGAFEAFAWFFFVGVIAYGTWYGWKLAESGMLHAGMFLPNHGRALLPDSSAESLPPSS